MTSYSGKRRSKERKIWNQFAFSDDAILYTHTTVPISTRNDEEIADNHLVDTVYSSKQKLLLQIRDSTKITTTTEKSTSKRASSYFRKRALDYCLYTLKKIMFYHHRSFFLLLLWRRLSLPLLYYQAKMLHIIPWWRQQDTWPVCVRRLPHYYYYQDFVSISFRQIKTKYRSSITFIDGLILRRKAATWHA